jgi:7-carboxy-7-deazaguanine synthase
MYAVKEIFLTLQGEGAQTGRTAVFCRFAGCNLWTGHEKDRHKAVCQFCDTDFVGTNGSGGGKFINAESLADAVDAAWPNSTDSAESKFVVCTGGEPLLQLDKKLVDELHKRSFFVAVETNGTQTPPAGIDWLCVSPKAGSNFILRAGNELKLVFPQTGFEPAQFEGLDFQHFFLQPMDGPQQRENVDLALRFCLENPRWRLSIQTHKLLGIR